MAEVRLNAATTGDALDRMLHSLGPDAVILGLRRTEAGVEIRAAAQHDARAARAARPVPPAAPEGIPQGTPDLPDLPPRLALFGPPGAGITRLALRLAALARTRGLQPRVTAAHREAAKTRAQFGDRATALGLQGVVPLWLPRRRADAADPDTADTDTAAPQSAPAVEILDLSGVDAPPLSRLPKLVSDRSAALWLVVPAGLHPALLDRLCVETGHVASGVVQTRCDLFAPGPDEAAVLARHRLPVLMRSLGPELEGALASGKDAAPPPPDPPAVPSPAAPAAGGSYPFRRPSRLLSATRGFP
ncbi:hypothetical protein [Frigidibacter oleivorans]|uniref:hypothetical protein n=1 Tax=Frigidibacter oleivorans TaxID=2487129 RepID=UPI0013DEBDCA|nr:hypothetical protein [Frigidibacter oleivorans]